MTATMSLRQAIVHRVENNSNEELREVIEDSVGNAEVTLPGLGVLFEIIWSNSEASEQQRMVDTLHQHIHNPTAT
ncbi:small acid-soluble spore protein SspI [Cohnella lubricantis]|uniref:Small, acid-soluble spore protein I n=1 Tax=Cohnella lubricantis TaxID=2163172 RepID=A0A841TJ27_9BACL|nr:small acid-soluble spore protein SspI [Cohnella lubricantis]MBB6678501.1 small acid-soluble spore protein SspI [Cohnella lubricantis]MBP2118424.1 small acid-soluble spore protein I (minor) [Cohnella lubricantis]